MINMFSQMACICHFVFYVLPRASYKYIHCGFIPCVVWRFSRYFFQLFRCRNLALNRVFPIFFSGRYVLHLVGIQVPPYLWSPPCIWTPPTPPYVETPTKCPQCSPVHMHVLGVSACDWGMWGALLLFGHPTFVWMPPYVSNTCHTFICSPACLYVLGVIACAMGEHPICWGLGVSAQLSGFWCLVSTSIACPLCFILYLSYSSLCLKSALPPLHLLLLQ